MPQVIEKKQLEALEALGWKFVQVADTEWKWLKFKDQERIAQQGDEIWQQDIEFIQKGD